MTAVATDVAIPGNCNIRKKEHDKIEKYHGPERGTQGDGVGEGNSGLSDNQSSWGSDPPIWVCCSSRSQEPHKISVQKSAVLEGSRSGLWEISFIVPEKW